jgi:cyclophilin family peptidyl-prolyl cis-trans isomerase
MSAAPAPRRPLAFILALLALLIVGVGAIAYAANRVAGTDSAVGVPTAIPLTTPTPAATPTPTAPATPTASPIAFADCGAASFGADLQPLNPPADIHKYSAAPPSTINPSKLYLVTMTTNRGAIKLCVQPQLAPITANIFVTLVRNHFYDGLKFPRADKGLVIQAGSPQNDQQGGPGFSFADEVVRNQYVLGCLAMANAGPNTSGSQFFICTGDDSAKFAPSYNLFGKVMTGIDVAQAINVGDTMTSVTVAEQT